MKRFLDFIRTQFVRHDWMDIDADRRRCKVCGRLEEYDLVASVEGSVWNTIWAGRPAAHR